MANNIEVGVRLTADSKGLVGESLAAKEAIKGIGETAKTANAESSAAAERFTANLKRQADTLGMTASQVRGYDAAQLKLNDAQRASVDASNRVIAAHERQQSSIFNLKSGLIAAAGAYISLSAAIGGGKAVIDAALAQERLNNTLTVAVGSAEAAAQEVKFLREQSEALGLQFATTARQYGKLAAASRGTALEGQATRDIFMGIAKASTVLGLSADEAGGALNAIQQMISKGTVAAEELRGQLGERLPGAFQMAARALGVTTSELDKMLVKGDVVAERLLPALALELEKTFGAQAQTSAQGLQAKINRLDNAFTDLKIAVGNTGILDLLSKGIDLATRFANALSGAKALSAIDQQQQKIAGLRAELESLNNRKHIPVLGDLLFDKKQADLLSQRIDDAVGDFKRLEQATAQAANKAGAQGLRPGVKTAPDGDLAKALEKEAKDREKAAQRAVEASEKTIAALKRETEEIGKNAIQKRMMSAAAEAAKAPTKELAQEIMASAQAWGVAAQQQEGLLRAEKERLKALDAIEKAEKEAARVSAESSRQAAQEWHSLWGGVETTAKTAFIQFAAHGKSAMQSIGESIKLSIIDVLYQLTIRKWIVNIGANLSGFAGVGGSSTAAGGGSALNLASMGLNAANLVKSGFGLPSMIGRGASALGFSAFGAGASGAASAGVFGPGGSAFLGGSGTAIGGTAATEFGLGATFGAGLGGMAAGAAGVLGGSLIAGNKSVAGLNGTTTSSIGAAIGFAAGGPIGAVIGGLIGGLTNALFGHGPLKFRQQSLQGDISATGFDGDITNVYRAKGGLLVGNKHKSISEELSLELQTQLDNTLGGFYTSAHNFAQNLGLSVDLVDNFTAQAQIKSEKGKQLTEEAIAQMMDGIGNDIARNALPIVDSLRKAGEDSFDTLSRLNSEFVTLADAATILGKSVAESRAFISGASFEGRSAFVDNAGGADALMQKAQIFAANFLTEAERIAPAQEQLNEQLGKLGLSTDLTKDQFRGLVQSFGQVNGVSEETLQSLLNLMPAFLTITNYTDGLAKSAQELADIERARVRATNTTQAAMEIELMRTQGKESQALTKARLDELQTIDASLIPLQQAIFKQQDLNTEHEKANAIAAAVANERTGLETQLLQIQGDTTALRQRELDALNPVNRALKEYIFGLEDEKLLKEQAGKQLDTAFSALQRAVDAERKGVAKHIADIAQSVNKLKDLSGSLRSALSRMQISGNEGGDRAAAQAQISAALAIAKASGKLPEAESLRRALDVVAQPSEDLFGSFTDYMRDFARTAADINSLDGLTQNQLGIEDQALRLAESQMTALDGILTTAQAELDAIRGVDNSIQTLAGALQGFASAKAAVGAAAGGGGSPAASNIPPLPSPPSLVSAAITPPIGSTGAPAGVTVLGGPGNPKFSGRDIAAFINSGVTPEQILGKAIETGVNAQQIASAMAASRDFQLPSLRSFIESKGLVPGFADGGLHGGGLRIVGERGPELEFTGPSRIVSNPESRKLLDLAEVVAELKALRAEMAAIKANTGSTATNTQKTSDLLDNVSAGGGPLLVTQVS